MRKIIIISIIYLLQSCNLAYAQQKQQYTSEKYITTAVDTMTVSTQSTLPYTIILTNESTTDTLQYRTNLSATWRYLFHTDESVTIPVYGVTKLYRRAVSDSVYSRAWSQ